MLAHTLVVSDGDVPDRAALDRGWPDWADGVAQVVAADGGALKAQAIGFPPQVVVGDLDSLESEEVDRLEKEGVQIERAARDKDESDTELAIRVALRSNPSRMTVLGALGGGRVEHTLANVLLLAMPELPADRVVLLDERSRVRLLRGTEDRGRREQAVLEGPVGDMVSLLPLGGDVEGITTAGLAFSLRDDRLGLGPARGLSNVRIATAARVSLRRGLLLVIETHQE